MYKSISTIVLIALCTVLSSAIRAQTESWLELPLQSAEGGQISVGELLGEQGAVLLFLDPDCPVSQKYGATIRRLARQFKEKGIQTIAIYPVVNIDEESVNTFASAYQYDFAHLLDPRMELTKSIGASVTPETYLLNSEGEIIYHGAIDNWYYELGRYRRVVTQHFLKDAASLHLAREPIAQKETKAIGCMIGTGMKGRSKNMHH
ncbi:redoxin domain-containing protein [Catalinimonas alkaloidigena]|uniref:redoxin domain-containing protein n=1 Tax=Catalinimonas alkaloidigena TaxID=1075417 RepID=UPI002404C8D7|nr:redoxin domain-containing protein [Catalinimonas alkaloidigena]